MRVLVLLVAVASLAACADPDPPAGPSPDAAEASALASAAPPVEATGTPRSVYTDLDLDACETLRTYEEGGGVELRCPGYDGADLFVSEGDLRFDLDAGVPNGMFTTQPAFNTLGDRVEWRLVDGEPVAVIVRYRMEAGDGAPPPRDELAVITVGTEGSPGCLVDWVPADASPSPNEAARALADREAPGFACPPAE